MNPHVPPSCLLVRFHSRLPDGEGRLKGANSWSCWLTPLRDFESPGELAAPGVGSPALVQTALGHVCFRQGSPRNRARGARASGKTSEDASRWLGHLCCEHT